MTLFKGCHVVKCNEDGKPAENEVHVQYKIVDLASRSEYDPDTQQTSERVFALLEKVR
jgi:hypothetical protein